MNDVQLLIIGNNTLWLLADKAIYWPQQKALLIADVHFGKAAAFRALGQPVPRGTTQKNLDRLDKLLEQYATDRLIFLGDFLHGPKSHAPATLAALQQWRQKHAHIHFILIRGNHDIKAGDPSCCLNIKVVTEPYLLGNFALQHIPKAHLTHHVIAGHLHPTFVLHGKGRQRLRLPCFYHEAAFTLLPSFGDFTGGFQIDVAKAKKVFVTDGTEIWPVIERQ
ncbi:MAG: ligase-associated DNA damage response endonuclease PdeM [Methylotenera sp.]|nr:ligase-associated DNA damage response endonuclease PdeM [Methylotenera sp.]